MKAVRPLLALSRQHWFVVALLLLFVGLSVQYSFKAAHPSGTRSAFLRWREQFQSWDGGEDIFRRYPNPPVMALILKPIAELPPLPGALTWFYLKVVMALTSLWLVFRMIEARGVAFPPWARAVTVLLSLRPIMGDLSHGNVNLFILFLVVLGLYAFSRAASAARLGWLLDVTAGVLIGLATACKVTPALFLPYFVWKRSWAAVGGFVLGLVLFFLLVPAAFLGWQENWQALQSWTRQMILPFVVQGTVTSEHSNQSLPGVVHRLLTHSPSASVYEHNQYKPLAYHNVLDLSPAAAGWVVKGCLVLFAAAFAWAARTSRRTGGWRIAAEFSLILLGMLLFSERTWKHHCVTLILPFGVLCYYLAACRPGRWLRGYLIGTLVVVALLMLATGAVQTERDGDLNRILDFSELAQVYGAYAWGNLLLAVALIVVLRRRDAASDGQVARGLPAVAGGQPEVAA